MQDTAVVFNKILFKSQAQMKLFHYFSLGEIVGKGIFSSDNEKFVLNLSIVNNPADYLDDTHSNFSTFYKVGKNSIYYERNYGSLHCKLCVTDLQSDQFNIYVNRPYLNMVRFKLDGLYPAGVHATDILLHKIISAGDTVVHGASLHNTRTNNSFLLIAPPDTGKTYTTYMLLGKGYKFLGEDLSYYDAASDHLLCMPLTSTWGHRFDFSKLRLNKIPFIGLFVNEDKKIVTDIFGHDSIAKSSKLARIYLLEKSSNTNKLTRIDFNKDVLRRALIIQRNEFSYYKNPLLRAYEYFNDIQLDAVFQKEADNLRKIFENKQIYIVQAGSHEEFHRLIDKNESSEK